MGAAQAARRGFASAAAPFATDSTGRILPHGGELKNLFVTDAALKQDLIASCKHQKECSDRNACDVELLSVGGFSPLSGFMNQDVYDNVVQHMRLPTSNLIFGLPVVLDSDDSAIKEGDRERDASFAHLTTHPVSPCATPAEVRETLPPHQDVVVFQCRNPVHRAHYELFTRALHAPNVRSGAVCLVHPTCGPTQDDDIPGIVRFHTYEVLKAELQNPAIKWAYLPYSMHMAGPREAIQHMLIRKNYGCTHFIVGRDMAGSKSSLSGEDFYGLYDAQNFAKEHAPELGMQTVPSADVVYTQEQGYVTADVAKKSGLSVQKLSGTKFRQMLRSGADIPEWFAFSSVVKVLREHTKASSEA
ncbi:Sulfate adenylyltransferase [Tetrabaena socialis]|uniref:Sulfate adenylyltransferase n=1 Tax=Tetrabaena socialis TaxID=47790 RepID=A0A2J8ABV3_9CHLO|nr:Sulfate adenylyltransferase [Tetrabaena socialis]|eukprot:PNH10001.1 Sulfate adenylyltransferase [Tetrabaena socialis]